MQCLLQCATQQDAEGGVSSTQAEVTQHGSENSGADPRSVYFYLKHYNIQFESVAFIDLLLWFMYSS